MDHNINDDFRRTYQPMFHGFPCQQQGLFEVHHGPNSHFLHGSADSPFQSQQVSKAKSPSFLSPTLYPSNSPPLELRSKSGQSPICQTQPMHDPHTLVPRKQQVTNKSTPETLLVPALTVHQLQNLQISPHQSLLQTQYPQYQMPPQMEQQQLQHSNPQQHKRLLNASPNITPQQNHINLQQRNSNLNPHQHLAYPHQHSLYHYQQSPKQQPLPQNIQEQCQNTQHLPPNIQERSPNPQHLPPNIQEPTPNPQHPPPNIQKGSPNLQHLPANIPERSPNTQDLPPIYESLKNENKELKEKVHLLETLLKQTFALKNHEISSVCEDAFEQGSAMEFTSSCSSPINMSISTKLQENNDEINNAQMIIDISNCKQDAEKCKEHCVAELFQPSISNIESILIDDFKKEDEEKYEELIEELSIDLNGQHEETLEPTCIDTQNDDLEIDISNETRPLRLSEKPKDNIKALKNKLESCVKWLKMMEEQKNEMDEKQQEQMRYLKERLERKQRKLKTKLKSINYCKILEERQSLSKTKEVIFARKEIIEVPKKEIEIESGNEREEIYSDTQIHNIICKKCQKSFLSKQTLREHQALHKDHDFHPCLHCHRRFSSTHALMSHGEKFHEDVAVSKNKTECFQCKKVFKSKSALLVHTRAKHTKEKPLYCQHCSKSFSSNSAKDSHERNHYNKSKQQCRKCLIFHQLRINHKCNKSRQKFIDTQAEIEEIL